jgi:hypothetical protein
MAINQKAAARRQANIEAYQARCAKLRERQALAAEARKAGFGYAGSDAACVAAWQEYQAIAQLDAHLSHPQYGMRLRRFLAGRQDRQPLAQVMGHINRFLSSQKAA